MNLKAALFDLDGTLIDTEKQYSIFWGEMGRHYRPDMPDFAQVIKGTTLTQIYDRYISNVDEQKEITKQLDEFEAKMSFDFYPSALNFIADLRRHNVKCAIVTSSNKAKMKSVIKQVPDFNSLFDKVLTSEDFTASKPAPDCFLIGAKAFNSQKDECIVFEDAFNGLEAGMRSGIFTFGLATTNPAEAIQDKCNYVLSSWEGLTYERITEIIHSKRS